jgi:hypothetical protein
MQPFQSADVSQLPTSAVIKYPFIGPAGLKFFGDAEEALRQPAYSHLRHGASDEERLSPPRRTSSALM